MSAYPGTHARLPEPASQRTALLALGAVLLMTLLFAVVSLQFLFPSPRTAARWQALGLESSFALASVTHIPEARVLLIRYQDGSFTAFPDVDPRIKALSRTPRQCLLAERSGYGSWYATEPIAGFNGTVLQEPCHASTYDMKGQRIFGPTWTDLSPVPIRLSSGYVEVSIQKGPRLP